MTKISVQLLSLLFGIGSWIAITGLWLEIPVLINHLPERWSLASDMNFIIQLANVGPLLYYLCKTLKLIDETKASHLLLGIGLLSCLLLIFGWNKTLYIWGTDRSAVLFAATFGLALLDCTSSVTFLPFMARFDSKYLTPYLIGEGLSGFVPTIFAILQGVEATESCQHSPDNTSHKFNISSEDQNLKTELRFSAEIFFTSLLVTLLVSWVALTLLQVLPVCKWESEQHILAKQKQMKNLAQLKIELTSLSNEKNNNDHVSKQNHIISRSKYYYLLSLIFLCCLSTFGFMPSIQPYSSLPYGNQTLHNVVILSGLSFPFGCFLAMVFRIRNKLRVINILTIFGHIMAAYIILCALMSPSPPFLSSDSDQLTFGSILMTLVWILFTTSLSFGKTLITIIISEYNGDVGLFWIGFHTQLGAGFGATLLFILVNYTNIFQENQC